MAVYIIVQLKRKTFLVFATQLTIEQHPPASRYYTVERFPSDGNIKQYRSGLASVVFAANVPRDTTQTFRQMYLNDDDDDVGKVDFVSFRE